MKGAHFRTVKIPCNNVNSGGGGDRSEEKESSDRVRSVIVLSVESVSNLLLLLLVLTEDDDDGVGDDEVERYLQGRMVAKSTTGKFSFRILANSKGMAMDPMFTGSRCKNSRMTVFGCVLIVDCNDFHRMEKSFMPCCCMDVDCGC